MALGMKDGTLNSEEKLDMLLREDDRECDSFGELEKSSS